MTPEPAAATAEAGGRVVLGGASIDVPAPLHYLEALWVGLRLAFPGDPGLETCAQEIERRLGYRPPAPAVPEGAPYPAALQAIVGWSGRRVLGELVDREWLDTDKNELDPLAGRLERTESLAGAVRPFVCAAGACGLVARLAAREGVERVEATDLSFLGLYLGRLLVEGRANRLPEAVRQPRILLMVDRAGTALRGRRVVPGFVRAAPGAADRIAYRVLDAFALPRPIPGDVVCVPHLLDVFEARRAATMLIRICEAMSAGQRLVLVTALNPQRHPLGLLRAARVAGMEVRRLQLEELPYSLSPYGFGFVRRVFSTLIVEAVKVAEADRRSIAASLSPVEPEPSFQGLRQRPYELTAAQRAAVERATGTSVYGELLAAVDDVLGPDLGERFLAHQLGSGGLRLAPPESS